MVDKRAGEARASAAEAAVGRGDGGEAGPQNPKYLLTAAVTSVITIHTWVAASAGLGWATPLRSTPVLGRVARHIARLNPDFEQRLGFWPTISRETLPPYYSRVRKNEMERQLPFEARCQVIEWQAVTGENTTCFIR